MSGRGGPSLCMEAGEENAEEVLWGFSLEVVESGRIEPCCGFWRGPGTGDNLTQRSQEVSVPSFRWEDRPSPPSIPQSVRRDPEPTIPNPSSTATISSSWLCYTKNGESSPDTSGSRQFIHLLFYFQGLHRGHKVAGHIAFSSGDERSGQPPVSRASGKRGDRNMTEAHHRCFGQLPAPHNTSYSGGRQDGRDGQTVWGSRGAG